MLRRIAAAIAMALAHVVCFVLEVILTPFGLVCMLVRKVRTGSWFPPERSELEDAIPDLERPEQFEPQSHEQLIRYYAVCKRNGDPRPAYDKLEPSTQQWLRDISISECEIVAESTTTQIFRHLDPRDTYVITGLRPSGNKPVPRTQTPEATAPVAASTSGKSSGGGVKPRSSPVPAEVMAALEALEESLSPVGLPRPR